MIRVGLGYDSHRLEVGRKLVIGGVEIPSEKGELGHSDGDALIHAIIDSLLGSAHLGDIGELFPDTDEKYKGACSLDLLRESWAIVKNAGYTLENIDCVILLERPKLLDYRKLIIENISKTLGVEKEKVFLKAKTGERLGSVGSGEAIEVFATCLLSHD